MTYADMLSIATEIEHEGVTYALRPPTQLEQGKFQRWLEQEARESVERATYLSDEARAQATAQITRDIASGAYEWGGEISVKRLSTVSGVSKLIQLVCGVDKELADRLANARLAQVVELVRGAQARDPKAVEAALVRLGLPANFLRQSVKSSSGSGTRRSGSRKRKSKR